MGHRIEYRILFLALVIGRDEPESAKRGGWSDYMKHDRLIILLLGPPGMRMIRPSWGKNSKRVRGQALSFPLDCYRKIQFETLPGKKLVLVKMIAIFNILRA
jgi:hypothetical protein